MLTRENWEEFRPDHNPFLRHEFFDALIKSGSIGPGSGWVPKVFSNSRGVLYTFIKEHSFGEFIFDWSWAEAYERYNVPYYPKLTSMVPFTPVTTQHFLMKKFDPNVAGELLNEFEKYYSESESSSAHFLFLTMEEVEFFRDRSYLIRESIQYHFINNFKSFDDYLNFMKGKKAKTIRQERQFPELKITQYTGNELNSTYAKRMYQYYISTIIHKNSHDYLNENFFELIFESMKDNILFVEASNNGGPIAGALFFYDDITLYGRYWGSHEYVHNLHFELCYYQGIDFCIKNNLKLFEAGAQGEHKIARGFRPVRVYSAHKIKLRPFEDAIAGFIEKEKRAVEDNIEVLSSYLPFKK